MIVRSFAFAAFSVAVFVAEPARADADALVCEPTSLGPDSSKLTLTLPDPHGRELAVKTPDGFFYLAWDASAGIDAKPRIEGFRDARVLTFDPRTLEGWHFHASNDGWKPIFASPGTYTFETADVLQTDATPPDSIPLSRCTVEYRK